MGPGPEIAKVASVEGCAGAPAVARRGEGSDGAIGAPVVTALRLEGRMLRAGSDGAEAGAEPEAGAAGGGICCEEVRLDRARIRGDSGTELRSGMLSRLGCEDKSQIGGWARRSGQSVTSGCCFKCPQVCKDDRQRSNQLWTQPVTR